MAADIPQKDIEKPSTNDAAERSVLGAGNQHADHSKLCAEGYGTPNDPAKKDFSAKSSKSDVAANGKDGLVFSDDIYGLKGALSGAIRTGFYESKFLDSFSQKSGDVLAAIFSNPANPIVGDAKPQSGTALSADAQKIIGSHKSGDQWEADGAKYFVDDRGDLIKKDAQGVHFEGKDGLRFEGNGRDGKLTKNGETVEKHGDHYYKTYANGDKVEITDEEGKKAVVQLKNMLIEQAKYLHTLDKPHLDGAMSGGSKVVTGPDGVQIYKKDENLGTLVAKDSREKGAKLRLENGTVLHAVDGKLLNEKGEEVKELPPGVKRRADGSLKIGSVTLSKDNAFHDADHDMTMADKASKVIANGSNGSVTTEVVDGKSVVTTNDRTYTYDQQAGQYTVRNTRDGSTDLTYDDATRNLTTNGVNFGPNGVQIGNNTFTNGGGIISGGKVVDGGSRSRNADGSVREATEGVGKGISTVALDIANFSGTSADLDVLASDLDIVNTAQNSDSIGPAEKEKLIAQASIIRDLMGRLQPEIKAGELAKELTGSQSPEVTKEILASSGNITEAEATLRRYGIPTLELYDSSKAA